MTRDEDAPQGDGDLQAMSDYIMAMKRNALARLHRGEEPEVIMIYADDCGHCHAQFRLFMGKDPKKHWLGVPIDIVELSRQEVESLYKKGKITRTTMENKLEIIDRIIPVKKTSVLGQEIKQESKDWAKKTGNLDAVVDMTPMWLHYKTHEVIGVGHRAGKNLKMLTSIKKNVSRQKRFSRMYSTILGKACTAVSCDPNAIVKIDGKTYKKAG